MERARAECKRADNRPDALTAFWSGRADVTRTASPESKREGRAVAWTLWQR